MDDVGYSNSGRPKHNAQITSANFAQKNRTAKKFLRFGNGIERLRHGFDFAFTPILATLTPILATLTPGLLFCGG